MKVLQVIPSIGPLRGGPSVVVRAMAHGLAQAGVTVDVVATDDNGGGRLKVPYAIPVAFDGVTYRYFPRQIKFYTFSWPLTSWLARHIKEYDVVHIHALFSYAALPAAYWAKRNNLPYIVRPLGVLNRWGMQNRRARLKRISFSLIEKRILARAAAIHFTSKQERIEAAELGIRGKSVVIPNPLGMPLQHVPPGRFRKTDSRLRDRLIVLFLSRLDPKKGLDLLLPAFARARKSDPKAILVIAGSGEPGFVSRLRRQSAQLGIASDVIWAGFLSGEQKLAALADADIFVLPSYSENFGVAAVEAMAAGLPVLVTDQVAIHREISAARAGLVVPCRIEELTDALLQLMTQKDRCLKMGVDGRRLASTKFSPDAVTTSLLNLYREICQPVARIPDQSATSLSK